MLGGGHITAATVQTQECAIKNQCTYLTDDQAEELYDIVQENIMQRFESGYKFENYEVIFSDANPKKNDYMVDIDVYVDMTWINNPMESTYVLGMQETVDEINDKEEKRLAQISMNEEVSDLMEEYNQVQRTEFSYRVDLGKIDRGTVYTEEAKFYHRVDITDTDAYIAEMPAVEKQEAALGKDDGVEYVQKALVETYAADTVSYNKSDAVKYAKKHAKDEPEFSSANGMGSDCANFVSKCLHAGGIPIDQSGKWYPSPQSGSYAGDNWMRTGYYDNGGVIPYMTDKEYFAKGPKSSVKLGSILYWNDKSHVALITYKDSDGTIKYTQHSSSAQTSIYKVYSSSMDVKFYHAQI